MTDRTDRVPPPRSADERTMLGAWLDWHRATVHRKCAGLTAAAAAAAPIATSPLMSVRGVVAHLRWVEQFWFDRVLLGHPEPAPVTGDDPDAQWREGARQPLAVLLTAYAEQCARSRDIAGKLDLGNGARRPTDGRTPATLRWVLVHMVEETARHNGHLDMLREMADGTRGQ